MTGRLLALVLTLAAATRAAADDSLVYTPPPTPAPPDPAGLLTRLVAMTAGVMALCAVLLLLARRAQRGPAGKGDPTGRFQHDGSLVLDRRAAVHLLRVDGQAVAVTTDAGGLRSITLLTEPFEATLAAANSDFAPKG